MLLDIIVLLLEVVSWEPVFHVNAMDTLLPVTQILESVPIVNTIPTETTVNSAMKDTTETLPTDLHMIVWLVPVHLLHPTTLQRVVTSQKRDNSFNVTVNQDTPEIVVIDVLLDISDSRNKLEDLASHVNVMETTT